MIAFLNNFYFETHVDLIVDDDRLKDLTLIKIEEILRSNGHSLEDFPEMPRPSSYSSRTLENSLLIEELSYDRDRLQSEHLSLMSTITEEQRSIYNVVMEHVLGDIPGVFFVDGFGGTGKTFLWRTLTSALRSKGNIVLAGMYFLIRLLCILM